MTAMEGEAGTQRVHVIEPHHPPPQVHTVWCFPSGLYRGHSLHCNHPTLRSCVELFNENHYAISIHGPRKKSMIRTERVSAVQRIHVPFESLTFSVARELKLRDGFH